MLFCLYEEKKQIRLYRYSAYADDAVFSMSANNPHWAAELLFDLIVLGVQATQSVLKPARYLYKQAENLRSNATKTALLDHAEVY